MKLQNDKDFYDTYSKVDYKLCDSKLLQIASKFLGTYIQEKISGSDFFPEFCNYHKDNENIKIFLLGSAQQNIVDTAMFKINKKYKREIVVGGLSPSFGFEKKEKENIEIIEKINKSGATVLAVGVGAPKQEKWIMEHKNSLSNIKIFMAIGATIDFEAGNIKRSPKWMSNNGLEWLYRLINEPKRLWKRYLIYDISFFWLILKQKLGFYKNPWEGKDD
jgi:N-acetylglucosaminyldiphosphoundecaprenol N-acetyl-beta-D-mannosaminyltransferase